MGHALKHRSLRAADEGEEIIGAARVFAVAGDIEPGRAGNAASFQLFMAFRIRNECAAVIHIHLKGIVDVGAKPVSVHAEGLLSSQEGVGGVQIFACGTKFGYVFNAEFLTVHHRIFQSHEVAFVVGRRRLSVFIVPAAAQRRRKVVCIINRGKIRIAHHVNRSIRIELCGVDSHLIHFFHCFGWLGITCFSQQRFIVKQRHQVHAGGQRVGFPLIFAGFQRGGNDVGQVGIVLGNIVIQREHDAFRSIRADVVCKVIRNVGSVAGLNRYHDLLRIRYGEGLHIIFVALRVVSRHSVIQVSGLHTGPQMPKHDLLLLCFGSCRLCLSLTR